MNYLASNLDLSDLATMNRAKQTIPDAGQLDQILENTITEDRLGRWVDRKPRRVATLEKIVSDRTNYTAGKEDILATPSMATGGPSSIASAGTQQLADELARSPEGRRAIASSYQVSGRVEDVRVAARDYRELLAKLTWYWVPG